MRSPMLSLIAALALAACGGSALEHREIAPTDGPLASIASVPGTSDLVLVARSGVVRVVDARTGDSVRELGPLKRAEHAVGTSAGQVWVLSYEGSDGQGEAPVLVRFDVSTGDELGRVTFASDQPYVNHLGVAPGGDLVHADAGRSTWILDGATGETVHRLMHPMGQVASRSSLSSDGGTAALYSGNNPKPVRIVVPGVGPTSVEWVSGFGFWSDFRLSPNGDHLLALHTVFEGRIATHSALSLFDTSTGKTLRSRAPDKTSSLFVSEVGDVVLGTGDGRIQVIDPQTLEVIFEKQAQGSVIGFRSLALLDRGRWAAVADADGTVRLSKLSR